MTTSLHLELRERLRGKGLRSTTSRLAVLEELHNRARPMSHEELMTHLGEARFDRATVYRILADLADIGILRRMDLGDHVWRFELLDPCRDIDPDHPHFLCDGCGEVTCLPPLELRPSAGAMPAALVGASLMFKVSGRCGRCLAA